MRAKRLASVFGVLLFAVVNLAAVCGSGAAPPAPQPSDAVSPQTPVPAYTACSKSDPNCQRRWASTPYPLDPAVLAVFAKDDLVRALVGDGELWKDYWLNMSGGRSGTTSVDILFARHVSFSGVVPTMSDPCSGHAGADERVDPDDPCRRETPVYSTRFTEFRDQRWVQVFVDVERGSVVDLYVPGSLDETVDKFIEYFTENRPAIATPIPTLTP